MNNLPKNCPVLSCPSDANKRNIYLIRKYKKKIGTPLTWDFDCKVHKRNNPQHHLRVWTRRITTARNEWLEWKWKCLGTTIRICRDDKERCIFSIAVGCATMKPWKIEIVSSTSNRLQTFQDALWKIGTERILWN